MSAPVEVLRLLRYRYANVKTMTEDTARWSIPANSSNARGRVAIDSAVLPLLLREDPPAPVALSAAIYTERSNPNAEAHPIATDAPPDLAAEACNAFGWGYEHDGTAHLVYVPQAVVDELEKYHHLTFRVANAFAEVVIEMEMP